MSARRHRQTLPASGWVRRDDGGSGFAQSQPTEQTFCLAICKPEVCQQLCHVLDFLFIVVVVVDIVVNVSLSLAPTQTNTF